MSSQSPPAVSVLVVAGGDELTPADVAALPTADVVVAADSGIDRAQQAGLSIDVAVGDFDSVSSEGLVRAEADGVRIERHPPDKDETDLELAMAVAVDAGAHRIFVASIAGGRFDHALANVLLLADRRFAAVDVDALVDGALVSVIHRRRALEARPGALVSLLAVGGPATGVTTTGLRYRLQNDHLVPSSTRGVSNVFVGTNADIAVTSGVLLAIQPEWVT